jgi:hypothetical protein
MNTSEIAKYRTTDSLLTSLGFSEELIQDLKAIIGLDYVKEGFSLYFVQQNIEFPDFDLEDMVMHEFWDRNH